MPVNSIIRSWSFVCADCGKEREMVAVETDLGNRFESITRWCGCSPSKLLNAAGRRSQDEGDPDPS